MSWKQTEWHLKQFNDWVEKRRRGSSGDGSGALASKRERLSWGVQDRYGIDGDEVEKQAHDFPYSKYASSIN